MMDVHVSQLRKNWANVSGFRPLSDMEIVHLERQGNRCVGRSGWKDVLVAEEGFETRWVVNCTFKSTERRLRIGKLTGKENIAARKLPSGLYNATIVDSIIGNEVRIFNCDLIENTVVGDDCAIIGCGIISKSGEGAFGNGTTIPVVIGVGGRDVSITAELELDMACRVAVNRHDKNLLEEHQDQVAAFVRKVKCPWNVFGRSCQVEHVLVMSDVYLGDFAHVSGSHVVNSTVLSAETEPTKILGGSDVRNSILLWDVHVDSQSIVHDALMYPCSHAERHGKLLQSILGPYSGVAEGEISESLVGPFLGFHHQSLLIASYWPAGRGNIGYGANVGSNHTGKAPDQELWHGEGVFYGLGCCVKFPSDFSEAPYSLIATGVTTLPQRVTFPFSLISAPSKVFPNTSPAYNEIHPGWVLSQNFYSVIRNQTKFKDRGSKSKRVHIDFRIFRPNTVAMMQRARDTLENVKEMKKVYTDRDIKGLGKNVMTEAARLEAIETYSFFMLYYAVSQGIWEGRRDDETLQNSLQTVDNKFCPDVDYTFTGTRPTTESQKKVEWTYQCAIIKNEGPKFVPNLDVTSLLQWYKHAARDIAEKTRKSKAKDEKRGESIIPGYIDAHGEVASSDKLLKRVFQTLAETEHAIEQYLSSLTSARRSKL